MNVSQSYNFNQIYNNSNLSGEPTPGKSDSKISQMAKVFEEVGNSFGFGNWTKHSYISCGRWDKIEWKVESNKKERSGFSSILEQINRTCGSWKEETDVESLKKISKGLKVITEHYRYKHGFKWWNIMSWMRGIPLNQIYLKEAKHALFSGNYSEFFKNLKSAASYTKDGFKVDYYLKSYSDMKTRTAEGFLKELDKKIEELSKTRLNQNMFPDTRVCPQLANKLIFEFFLLGRK